MVFVPVPQMRAYQKIQTRLVRELEKKFSGRQVVFIAQRRILPKPTRKMNNKSKQKRPMRCVLGEEGKGWCLCGALKCLRWIQLAGGGGGVEGV